MSDPALKIISCIDCAVGLASGTAQGQFCPFVNRARQAGELLMLAGEPAEHCWFVKEGTVALYREANAHDAGSSAYAVRFPGSFVGLEAMVSDRYLDTARATTDVVVCGITRTGMDAWLGAKGTPCRTALEISLRSSVDPRRRTAASGPAIRRVADWLCDEGPRGSAAALPRKLVAELLGMRAETFSRALAQLAASGAIVTTRRTLRIVDERALEQFAGRTPHT